MAVFSMRALYRARILLGFSLLPIALAAMMVSACSAVAADAPEWKITAYTSPTNLPPGGTGQLTVTAVNVGGAATDGSTVTVEDKLPAGLTATEVVGVDVYAAGPTEFPTFGFSAGEMSCTLTPNIVCIQTAAAQSGDQLTVRIKVKVEPGAPASVVNQANVSGGGASQASISGAIAVSGEQAGFGLAPGSVFAGFSSHQAGAHANVSTGFAVDTVAPYVTAGAPKDVAFQLPPGAVGNTVGMPRCTADKATRRDCPADTIVGVATVEVNTPFGPGQYMLPVYNIEPSPGEPAAFMFVVIFNPVRLDTSVLSNGNYAVHVTAANLGQTEPVFTNYLTIWGIPADHQGPGPIKIIWDEEAGVESVGGPSSSSRVPLLSNPTQCTSPLTALAKADAWRKPGVFETVEAPMGSVTGCNLLSFGASLSMLPDTLEAGAPAGYSLDLSVPQANDPDVLAVSNVNKVVTRLPLGTVISPSSAQGLAACSDEQFFGNERGLQTPAKPAKCPNNSQVGTVQITTPALPQPLTGDVYLASPECHPCSPKDAEDGKMVRLFVQVVGEGGSGIVVGLEGRASIDQTTGQITATFENNPQLPFSDFKLVLGGGSRATLANPRPCGPVTTNMDLTPWSAPSLPDATPSYTFEINQNCFGPQFKPSFVSGMPNIQAGEYGSFTLAFGRADNDEYLGRLTTDMPQGLLGKIAGIPLCKETQAIAGTCDLASQIGTVEALTGAGANPFLVSGGHVFLTEGYGGAPYGLSIVVPAVAGPYTLSGTNGTGSVVVRAQIFVDEHTAQLRVVSGQLPSMLDGIPLQLKAVNVRIDKPQFTFNPTSCAKMSIVGTLTAVEGLSATVSDSFQVTNCASLAFKPGFKVSTTGRTSRTSGAGLDVKLSYPSETFGKYANIKSVKVNLPKQLPSRLTTLQKACPDSTFNANPAACPAASRVGAATATTPILGDTLTGPAYFVSHGGAKFPELVVVLSGDGVTVQLDGETFISKAGITSSTFRQIPDVPVSTFELKLPQGAGSALAANGNLCTSVLKMPTAFTAQNGLVVHQTTPITATGCSKHKAKHKKKK